MTEMRVSDGSDPTSASWEPLAQTKAWALPAPDGEKTVSVQFRDAAGNLSAAASDSITLDTLAPSTSIEIEGGVSATSSPVVALTTLAEDGIGSGVVEMRVADGGDPSGAEWRPFAGSVSWVLPDGDGLKIVSVQVRDQAGNHSIVSSASIELDTAAPVVTDVTGDVSVAPSDATVTIGASVVDGGTGAASVEVMWRPLGGSSFTAAVMGGTGGSAFEAVLSVGDGIEYYLVATDGVGNTTRAPEADGSIYTVTRGPDTTGPAGSVVIADGRVATSTLSVELALEASDDVAVTEMRVGDGDDLSGLDWEPYSTAKTWTLPAEAGDGARRVSAQFRDAAGNESIVVSDDIELDTTAPAILSVTGDTVVFEGSDLQLSVATSDTSGVAEATLFVGPVGGEVEELPMSPSTGDVWAAAVASPTESLAYYVEVADAAGNVSRAPAAPVTFLARFEPVLTELDAPPIDPTVEPAFSSRVDFLYKGPTATQQAVIPGSIDPDRVAVVRGRVLTRDGGVLPNVRVELLDDPDVGFTYTRADGWFDLAVNGGGERTVRLTKDGFLEVQRSAEVPPGDWAITDEVTMIPRTDDVDVVVPSSIPLGEYAAAVGPTEQDVYGERASALLIEGGTEASAELSDGSTVPLPALALRQTEYTVGDAGVSAMPGEMPETQAYTYAIKVTTDEAEAIGATTVSFSRPVIHYHDNHLGAPVGAAVPTAYYDTATANWIPVEDGHVVAIVGESGGLAEIDASGDGIAESPTELAGSPLDIDDAERSRLAEMYDPGAELWRVELTRFSAVDMNPSVTCGDKSGNPVPCEGPDAPVIDDEDQCSGCGCPGSGEPQQPGHSVIGCESQTVRESIPLAGTDLDLSYSSFDQFGRTSRGRRIVRYPRPVGLAGTPVRASVSGDAAGTALPETQLDGSSDAVPFEAPTVDAYGRAIFGAVTVNHEVCHVYRRARVSASLGGSGGGVFSPPPLLQTWGQGDLGAAYVNWPMEGLLSGPGSEIQICAEFPRTYSVPGHANNSAALGGWRISNHHAMSPTTGDISLGDGTSLRAEDLRAESVVSTLVGGGTKPFKTAVPGDLATDLDFNELREVAIDSKGNLYVSDFTNQSDSSILRFDADGRFVARYSAGNEVGANYYNAQSMAFDSQDRLVFLRTTNSRGAVLYRLEPGDDPEDPTDDEVVRLSGSHSFGQGAAWYTGDGGPAINARIGFASGLAIDDDDNIYLADPNCDCVRKITPDGTINTYAGGNGYGRTPDGTPATQAKFADPIYLDVDDEGNLVVSDDSAIMLVTRDGSTKRLAGGGSGGVTDGSGALTKNVVPLRIKISRDGQIYFTMDQGGVLGTYRMGLFTIESPQGATIHLVHEKSTTTSEPDGGNLRGTMIPYPGGFTFDSTGHLHLTERYGGKVRASILSYRTADGTANPNEIRIPSPDAGQVWIFNREGRHLRTVDGLTQAIRAEFAYNAEGRLASVGDGDGNFVQIQRDPQGRASAIVGPYGHVTHLSYHGDGYLAAVTDPLPRQWVIGYAPGGLLTSFTDPLGGTSQKQYDALGRLTSTLDPLGNTSTLTRTDLPATATRSFGREITWTSAAGRQTLYRTEIMKNGDRQGTVIEPSGARRTVLNRATGSSLTAFAGSNGVTQQTVEKFTTPDPRWGQSAAYVSKTITTMSGIAGSRTDELTITSPGASTRSPLTFTSVVWQEKVNTVVADSTTWDTQAATLTTVSNQGVTSTTRYDERGRPELVAPPGVVPTAISYDVRGRVIQATQDGTLADRTWQYGYGPDGYVDTITDPLSQVTDLSRDAIGRVLNATQDGLDLGGNTLDKAGNVVSLRMPNQVNHEYAYDSKNRPVGYVSPEDRIWKYEWNPDNQFTSLEYPDGSQGKLEWTSGGQLASITDPVHTRSFTYDSSGRVGTSTESGVALTNTWSGRILKTQEWTGDVSGTVNRTFDTRLRLIAVSVNTEHPTEYHYDDDDRIISAGEMTISYEDGTNRIERTDLGAVIDRYTYDEFGDLQSHTVTADGNIVFSAVHERDPLGRLTRVVEGDESTTFTYDNRNRLNKAADESGTRSYTYDANGNRLARTDGGATETGTFDGDDRLQSYDGASYYHTPNGETATRIDGSAVDHLQYDRSGGLRGAQLSDGTVLSFQLDGQGRRVAEDVNGTRHRTLIYQDQVRPAAELGSGDAVDRLFVYGLGSTATAIVEGDDTFKIVTDHLDSPRLVIDANSGDVIDTSKFDEFGRVVDEAESELHPFAFAGGLRTSETDYVRFGARDYDTTTGRWTTPEPLGQVASGNVFEYAKGDPVNRSDHNGEQDAWTPNTCPIGSVPVPLADGTLICSPLPMLPMDNCDPLLLNVQLATLEGNPVEQALAGLDDLPICSDLPAGSCGKVAQTIGSAVAKHYSTKSSKPGEEPIAPPKKSSSDEDEE